MESNVKSYGVSVAEMEFFWPGDPRVAALAAELPGGVGAAASAPLAQPVQPPLPQPQQGGVGAAAAVAAVGAAAAAAATVAAPTATPPAPAVEAVLQELRAKLEESEMALYREKAARAAEQLACWGEDKRARRQVEDATEAVMRMFRHSEAARFMAQQYPNGEGLENLLYFAEGPQSLHMYVERLFFGVADPDVDAADNTYYAVCMRACNRQDGAVNWVDTAGVVGLTARDVVEVFAKIGGEFTDNVFADDLEKRPASDIAGALRNGGELQYSLHASCIAGEKICELMKTDCSPPPWMVNGQRIFGITSYAPYLEYILTIAGKTKTKHDLGTHIDGFTTGTALLLLSGIKIVLLARPTIENLVLFGKNKDRPMLEVGYNDMIALLVLAGDVVAFPALTIHEVINITQESCMAARTCQTPATTEPLLDELTRLLENPRTAQANRRALAYVVQVLIQDSSAEGESEVTAEQAVAELQALRSSHREPSK